MEVQAAPWKAGAEGAAGAARARRGTTLRWFASFLRPALPRLALVMLLSLTAAGAGLAQPYLTKRLVDDGLLAGQPQVVLEVAGLMVALALIALFLGASTRLVYVDTSARILHSLRESLFAHLLSLSPEFFARTRQGELMVRLDTDVAELQRFALDLLLSALTSSVMLAGSLVILYHLSPALTQVMLLLLVLNAVFLRSVRPQIERLSRRTRERGASIASFLVEVLGATKSVQSYNGQQRECETLGRLHRALRQDTLRLQFIGYAAGALPGFLLALGTVGIFVFGTQSLQGHAPLTLGGLIAFASYVQRASGPIQSLLGMYVALQRARVSLDRVAELAAMRPAVAAPAAPLPLPPGNGRIDIACVSFSYPDAAGTLLEQAQLSIPAGAKLLLQGPSGAGKSTLADLLQRHYDPQRGSIRLDGVDLRHVDCAELRRAVVVVAQDAMLFAASIADNIRYGRPGASPEEVQAAARLARVDEFAAQLPQGLDTEVGERGAALSGGQRQRIALARAVLMHPRVLILDESTSGLDPGMDAEIRAAIDELFAGRTRIVVSHRPLPAAQFDLVAAIEGGRLVAQRS